MDQCNAAKAAPSASTPTEEQRWSAYGSPEEVLRATVPYWSAYLWSSLLDTTEAVTTEEADRMAAQAVEDYIDSCLPYMHKAEED